MVMEASRAEYLADNKFKPQLGRKGSSTSGAEPSSSGASKYSDFTRDGTSLRTCVHELGGPKNIGHTSGCYHHFALLIDLFHL
jgi:hypothetical protein